MKYNYYPQQKSTFVRVGKPTILSTLILFGITQLPWLLVHSILWGIDLGEQLSKVWPS